MGSHWRIVGQFCPPPARLSLSNLALWTSALFGCASNSRTNRMWAAPSNEMLKLMRILWNLGHIVFSREVRSGKLLAHMKQVVPLEPYSQGSISRLEKVQFSSVQSLSRVRLFVTPWTAACQASLSITNSQSLLKLMPIESVMPSNHLILCHPLLLPPSIFPSIRVFSSESDLHIRWPKYWSFSFYISPSNEHSRMISFRMDWLDLLAVQGTLKSLLQHHSSKHQFFGAQLSL